MKRFLFLAVLSSSQVASASPRLELEVGGGPVLQADFAPSLSARVGVDFAQHFTPSLKVLTLSAPGSERMNWATLGEFRAHTSGIFQVSGALGLGFGTAVIDTRTQGVDAQFFKVAPYISADLGARVMFGRFWVGMTVGGMPLEHLWMATLSIGVAPIGDLPG